MGRPRPRDPWRRWRRGTRTRRAHVDLLEQAVHTIGRITLRRYTNSRLQARKFIGSPKRSQSGSRKHSHSGTRKESHSSSEITTGTTKESQSGSKISTVLTRNDHTPKPESPVRQARTALDSNQVVPVNLTYKLTRKQQTFKFKSISTGFPNHSYAAYQQGSANTENDRGSGIKNV